jgi:hypothetical protein
MCSHRYGNVGEIGFLFDHLGKWVKRYVDELANTLAKLKSVETIMLEGISPGGVAVLMSVLEVSKTDDDIGRKEHKAGPRLAKPHWTHFPPGTTSMILMIFPTGKQTASPSALTTLVKIKASISATILRRGRSVVRRIFRSKTSVPLWPEAERRK